MRSNRARSRTSIARRGTVLLCWTGLSLLAMALGGCGFGRTPESAVSGFYHAVEENNITEAKTFLSATLIGLIPDAKLSAGLSSASQEIRQCGGIKAIDTQLSGEENVRKGRSTLTFKGQCPPKSDGVKLVKEDGKWKLAPDK